MNCAVLRLCPEMANVQILVTLMVTVLKEPAAAFSVSMAMTAESVSSHPSIPDLFLRAKLLNLSTFLQNIRFFYLISGCEICCFFMSTVMQLILCSFPHVLLSLPMKVNWSIFSIMFLRMICLVIASSQPTGFNCCNAVAMSSILNYIGNLGDVLLTRDDVSLKRR